MSVEPLIWEKYANNFQIADIPLSRHQQVKDFMLANYVNQNVVHEAIGFPNDDETIEEYFKFIDYLLKDDASLMIVETETDTIVGVLLVKIMKKDLRSWTQLRLVTENAKLNILLLMNRSMILQNSDENEIDTPRDSLHIFEICVAHKYKGQNWKPRLLECAHHVAGCLKLPTVTFVALLNTDQVRAVRAGYVEKLRVYYTSYADEKGVRPFRSPKGNEFYAILYERNVIPVVPFYEMR